MSFQRYPKYKDSGAESLGDVPEHWHLTPLKHLASLKGRLGWQGLRADEYTEDGPFLVTSEHFANDRIEWHRCYHVSHERFGIAPEIQLRAHDLLMMKDGAAMGKLAYVDDLPGPACLNSHLLLFRPLDGRLENRFLYYVLGSPSFNTYMLRERKGSTFFGISQESIGAFQFAVPPIHEQHLLSGFLDRETARIDGLVAEQRRLMELLKEKRQAVIFQAVTKGLNFNAPTKSSGIEWFSDMPAHWELRTIKRFSKLQRGHDLTDSERTEGPYPVVTSGGINGTHGSFMTRGPGVVTGRYGSTGRLFYIEEDFWPHNTSLYVCDFCGNLPRFVWYSLHTVDFAAHSAKAAVPGIDRNDIHGLHVAVPPIDEQAAVVVFLDSETAKLDALSAKAQQAIDLLQERRTALISAAVTGQIDVRNIGSKQAA